MKKPKSIYGDQNDPSRNDPVLINPAGVEMQVPEKRVDDLLKKGYQLKDPNWRATGKGRGGKPHDPTALFSRARLEEDLKKDLDRLDVIII